MKLKRFESFVNDSKYHISKITKEDLPEVIDLVYEVFKDIVPETREEIESEITTNLNYNLFFKITNNENKIVGTYQVDEIDLVEFITKIKNDPNSGLVMELPFSEIEKWKGQKGLIGIQLSVLKEFRDEGAGKKLITYISTLGYPYIVGQHYETLGNIEHWKKRRKVVGYYFENGNKIFITLGEFKS